MLKLTLRRLTTPAYSAKRDKVEHLLEGSYDEYLPQFPQLLVDWVIHHRHSDGGQRLVIPKILINIACQMIHDDNHRPTTRPFHEVIYS